MLIISFTEKGGHVNIPDTINQLRETGATMQEAAAITQYALFTAVNSVVDGTNSVPNGVEKEISDARTGELFKNAALKRLTAENSRVNLDEHKNILVNAGASHEEIKTIMKELIVDSIKTTTEQPADEAIQKQ